MIDIVSLRSEVAMHEHIGTVPRLHPNGFIQLDLGRTRRLHIWPDPKLPAQQSLNPIHDHAFSFTSTCILGRLLNVEYVFDTLIGSETAYATHVLWRAEQKPDSEDTLLVPLPIYGRVRALGTTHSAAGETYSFEPRRLHDSVPVGLTATVMEKREVLSDYRPVIVVKVGAKPDNRYSRYAIGPKVLWAWIDKVMEKL